MNRWHVFTIGHSNHSLEMFASLLRLHGVTAVADVRSAPFSRFNPQFNKEILQREVRAHGLEYVFLGRELGARPHDPSFYKDGQVQFARLKQTPSFQRGLERVMRGLEKHSIALMCSEKSPQDCHRALLIAPALRQHGIAVRHILADGALEAHESTLSGLSDSVPQEDLFDSREELALALQERRVAHIDKRMGSAA